MYFPSHNTKYSTTLVRNRIGNARHPLLPQGHVTYSIPCHPSRKRHYSHKNTNVEFYPEKNVIFVFCEYRCIPIGFPSHALS